MVDSLTPERRSEVMKRVRSKNTSLEWKVRRLVFSLGYRYRLHRRDLPGSPDLVFASRKKVIFVHGCFWHRHDCPLGNRSPKSRMEFWDTKLSRNAQRDREVLEALERLDWSVLTVWECQVGDTPTITARIRRFLDA